MIVGDRVTTVYMVDTSLAVIGFLLVSNNLVQVLHVTIKSFRETFSTQV